MAGTSPSILDARQVPVNVEQEKPTGSEQYKLCHWRVESSLRWRQNRVIGDTAWRLWLDLYNGQHYTESSDELAAFRSPRADRPRNKITINVAQSIVQDFMPFLSRQNPSAEFRPMKQEGIAAAPKARALMDYYWNELEFQTEYRTNVLDMAIMGHCVAATGFNRELDEAVGKKPGAINYEDYVRAESPTYRRVDPFMFVIDPSAKNHRPMQNGRWCAEIVLLPLADIVVNRNFNSTVRAQIRSGEAVPDIVDSFLHKAGNDGNSFRSELDQNMEGQAFVACFHYWDKKFGKYYFFASGVETPLIEENWKFPYLDGFPYAMGRFIEMPNEPYGMGLMGIMEDPLLELDRVATAIFQHRRKFGKRKFILLKNALNESEKGKLFSATDEDIESTVPPDMAVKVLDAPALPNDQYQALTLIMEWIRELSGRDQLLSGGKLPSRTSAREIEARQQMVNLKARERVNRVDQFATKVWGQLWQHIRANLTLDQVVEITGDDGEAVWEPVTPQDVQHQFDLKIISSSKEEFDPVSERAARINIMQIYQQNAESINAQGWDINWPAITDFVMETFDRKETTQFLAPRQAPPPPIGPPGAEAPVTGQGGVAEEIQRDSTPQNAGALGAALGGGQ